MSPPHLSKKQIQEKATKIIMDVYGRMDILLFREICQQNPEASWKQIFNLYVMAKEENGKPS